MDAGFDGRTDCGYEAVNGLPTIAGDRGEIRPLQPGRPFSFSFTLIQLFESFVNLVPIHYVPPRGQILRTAVLILQVVRVLPDIVSHNGMMTIHNGVVLVSGRNDL